MTTPANPPAPTPREVTQYSLDEQCCWNNRRDLCSKRSDCPCSCHKPGAVPTPLSALTELLAALKDVEPDQCFDAIYWWRQDWLVSGDEWRQDAKRLHAALVAAERAVEEERV